MVVGGGIAGLATAVGLSRSGWQVTVHERRATAGTAGTSLALWPAAVRALQHLGLQDLLGRSASSSGALLRDPGGRTLARAAGDQTLHFLDRSELVVALLGQVPRDAITWSSPVAGAADLQRAASGADLVVGADGLDSAVRRLLFRRGRPGDRAAERRAAPRPLGMLAIRGTSTAAFPGGHDGPAVVETWGRGQVLGTTLRADGRTNTYACLRLGVEPDVLASATTAPLNSISMGSATAPEFMNRIIRLATKATIEPTERSSPPDEIT